MSTRDTGGRPYYLCESGLKKVRVFRARLGRAHLRQLKGMTYIEHEETLRELRELKVTLDSLLTSHDHNGGNWVWTQRGKKI